MKFSGLTVLALVCISSAVSASTVQLGYAGPQSNPIVYTPGQYSLTFSLAADTQVNTLGLETTGFALGAQALDTYTGSLAGSGGAVSWAPGGILSAGSYTYTATVNSCSPSCISINDFLAVNFYLGTPQFPLSVIQTGGTFQPGSLTFGTGWDLIGNTVTSNVNAVPEPSSAALLGTGLLAAFAGMRRRFHLGA